VACDHLHLAIAQICQKSPPEPPRSDSPRAPISPEIFFGELAKEVKPDAVEFAKWAVAQASSHHLEVQWMKAGPVFKFVDTEHDVFFTLGQFDRYGELSELFRFSNRCEELGLSSKIWEEYFDGLVKLIPGSSRKHFKSKAGNEWDDIIFDENSHPLESLASIRNRWFALIDKAIDQIKMELKGRPPETTNT
jgi:hypothetical protein